MDIEFGGGVMSGFGACGIARADGFGAPVPWESMSERDIRRFGSTYLHVYDFRRRQQATDQQATGG